MSFGIFFLLSGMSCSAIDPVDELQGQINELENLKKMSEDATSNLEAEVKNLSSRINAARRHVAQITVQMEELATSIEQREQTREEKTELLGNVVAKTYKSSRQTSPLLILLDPESNHSAFLSAVSYQAAQKRNQQQIQDIVNELIQLQ